MGHKYQLLSNKSSDIFIVNIFNGDVSGGGLADRIKGILTTFYFSDIYNIPYKLYFNSPFSLIDYLEPNVYNWCINFDELSFDINNINVVSMMNYEESNILNNLQYNCFEKICKKIKKQTHIYTNSNLIYNFDYSKYFNYLFKPTDRLRLKIDSHINKLKDYISVSCRFMNLLGDFNETSNSVCELSSVHKSNLMQKVSDKINEIHLNNINKIILINSDSVTFLEYMKKFPFVYTISGEVTHIDNSSVGNNNYNFFEKTFLDFFLIAHASKIFLLKTGNMYRSGYPYAASRVYNKEFFIIDF